jgi:hypothetical protein
MTAAVTVDVTPPLGRPLAGYLARGDASATGAHDPLEASLLWLAVAPGKEVVWVTLDALAVDTSLSSAIRASVAAALACPSDHVVVCASHTHSGPAGWIASVHPGLRSGRDEQLARGLVDRLGAVAAELPSRLVPVDATWNLRVARGVGANRNHPDGPHDDTTGVLALRHGNAQTAPVVGLLFDYACHPTVLDHANVEWSADWPGAARHAAAAAVAELTGFSDAGEPAGGRRAARPVVGFLQGAAGDSSPRFVRQARGFAEAARLGGLLASSVIQATLGADARVLTGAAPLVRRATATLPTRKALPGDRVERLIAAADAAWRKASAEDPESPGARIARTRLEGAQLRARLDKLDLPTAMELPLAVVVLGDVAWAHVPVELFASLGARIKEASPFAVTRVVGYTDGYFGYVADAAAHAEDCYEALVSFFDPAAGDLLVAETVALLRETWREAGTGR